MDSRLLGLVPTFAVLVWFSFAAPLDVRAQQVNEAKVDVSTAKDAVVKPGELGTGQGSSIAAVRVGKGNRLAEDFDVNGAGANEREKSFLRTLLDAIAGAKLGDATEVRNQIRTGTAPKPGETFPPTPAAFTEVGKGATLETRQLSKATQVGNQTEEAKAKAKQTRSTLGANYVGDHKTTSAQVGRQLSDGVAAALSVNRDPVAVEWEPNTTHEITVDLSGVALSVSTVGVAFAHGVWSVDAAFINGSSDITLPETSAQPLYDLMLRVVSINGGAPFLDTESFVLDSFGNDIFDSADNSGIDAVTVAILERMVPIGEGEIGFAAPYSFTVRLPGQPAESVVFLRDFAAGSAEGAGVPHPSSLALVSVACLALAILRRRRASLMGK
jgi:hypothetical protein